MTDALQALEEVARTIAPDKAVVRHLCAGGQGTFSVSTRPSEEVGDETYALKVVSSLHSGSERTADELAALRDVRHPNLVRYRAYGTARHKGVDYRWLAMDHIEGTSLRQLLAQGNEFELTVAVGLLSAAVAGAAALWDVGTAHGDLSAENLIVTPSGDLVIVDLGFKPRRAASGTACREVPGGLGTDFHGADWRSDQVALGMIGYRLISGVEAFPDRNDEAPSAPTESRPARASDLNHEAPSALSDIIATLIAPDPSHRYPNPAALMADLKLLVQAMAASPG